MNYYELLNIARDSNSNDIKRAYFSAVKLHSPDADPEGFKSIRIAYETLSDHKKRCEYDAYFIADGGGAIAASIQNDLLSARALIRENKYKQAEELLTGLSVQNPGSAEVKRLLAEVLWHVKKSVSAEKLCDELLEKNPSDCDTLLLRAQIAVSKGHTTKADNFFNDTVTAAPHNSRAWIAYMHYALKHRKEKVLLIFHRAMEQNINMFSDEYSFYLVGAYDAGLFNNKHKLDYYNKFAEFFINDKASDEDTYWHIMELMPGIIEKEELLPFVEKILPALENSKYRQKDDKDEEDGFRCIRAAVLIHKLRLDKRIHDVFTDLTGFILAGDKDKNEQLSMECYIVFNVSELRPSLKILKNEYPECFKLNQLFYLDVLNEKKIDFLENKYYGVLKKIRREVKGEPDYQDNDDDYDEIDEATPIVRESPKVGRNDPCPCGSGKKYKKCCGRN